MLNRPNKCLLVTAVFEIAQGTASKKVHIFQMCKFQIGSCFVEQQPQQKRDKARKARKTTSGTKTNKQKARECTDEKQSETPSLYRQTYFVRVDKSFSTCLRHRY